MFISPPASTTRRCSRALRAGGVGIQELELVQPDLEQVFVRVMRKA